MNTAQQAMHYAFTSTCVKCGKGYTYISWKEQADSKLCGNCAFEGQKKITRNILKDYLFEQNIEIGIND